MAIETPTRRQTKERKREHLQKDQRGRDERREWPVTSFTGISKYARGGKGGRGDDGPRNEKARGNRPTHKHVHRDERWEEVGRRTPKPGTK